MDVLKIPGSSRRAEIFPVACTSSCPSLPCWVSWAESLLCLELPLFPFWPSWSFTHRHLRSSQRKKTKPRWLFLIAITINARYWDQQINVLKIKKKSGWYILYASCTWGKWKLQKKLFHWRGKDTWFSPIRRTNFISWSFLWSEIHVA